MKSKEVKNLVSEYFRRLINEKDISVCDELLSPDYVDHDAPADTPPGPESIKQYMTMFLHDYPDMQAQIEDIIAEGNKAAARIIWCGTHRETGEKFHKMGIVILHLNTECQLAERWSAYEPV